MHKERVVTQTNLRHGVASIQPNGWFRDTSEVTSSDAQVIDWEPAEIGFSSPCTASKSCEAFDIPTSRISIPDYQSIPMGDDSYRLQTTMHGFDYNTAGMWPDVAIDKSDDLQSELASSAVRIQTAAGQSIMDVPRGVIELHDLPRTVQTLVPVLLNAKVRKAIRAGASISEAAGLYLAYQFGVKPTVGDVNRFLGQRRTGKITLQARMVKYEKDQRVRMKISLRPSQEDLMATLLVNTWSNNGTDEVGDGPLGSKISYGSQHVESILPAVHRISSIEYEGVVYGRVKTAVEYQQELVTKIAMNSGWLSTAWELTPMSFVVDWFYDVGSAIRRLEQAQLMARYRLSLVEGVWKSIRRTVQTYAPSHIVAYNSTVRGVVPPVPYRQFDVTWSATCKVTGFRPLQGSTSYVRAPIAGSNQWALPTLDTNLNGWQLGIGAAMVAQTCTKLGGFSRR